MFHFIRAFATNGWSGHVEFFNNFDMYDANIKLIRIDKFPLSQYRNYPSKNDCIFGRRPHCFEWNIFKLSEWTQNGNLEPEKIRCNQKCDEHDILLRCEWILWGIWVEILVPVLHTISTDKQSLELRFGNSICRLLLVVWFNDQNNNFQTTKLKSFSILYVSQKFPHFFIVFSVSSEN